LTTPCGWTTSHSIEKGTIRTPLPRCSHLRFDRILDRDTQNCPRSPIPVFLTNPSVWQGSLEGSVRRTPHLYC
jgi:hypothetical protein